MSGKNSIPVGESKQKMNSKLNSMNYEFADEADFYPAENPAAGMNGQENYKAKKNDMSAQQTKSGSQSRIGSKEQ